MSEYRRFKIEKTEIWAGAFRWKVYGLTGWWPFREWEYIASCHDEARAREIIAEKAAYPAVRYTNYFHADGSEDFGSIW